MRLMTINDPVVLARARIITRLCHDLNRHERGYGPTRLELAAAPTLVSWQPVFSSVMTLCGSIEGHDPTEHFTSEVYVLDAAAGYCRTFTKLYRLGSPADRDGS